MPGKISKKILNFFLPSGVKIRQTTFIFQALKVGLDHDCLDLLEGGGDLWIEPGAKCPTVIRTRRVLDMHDEKNWNQVCSFYLKITQT